MPSEFASVRTPHAPDGNVSADIVAAAELGRLRADATAAREREGDPGAVSPPSLC